MLIIRITEQLPPGIDGLVLADADGNDNIYINDRLSPNGRTRALVHELRHVEYNDCYKDVDACNIEQERKGKK